MNALLVAFTRMFSLESILATLFFSVFFYVLLLLAVIISVNYTVTMWVVVLPCTIMIILALQEYCRDLIGKVGTFSSEKVVLSAVHFNPLRGNNIFIIQIFLFLGSYKLITFLLGSFLPDQLIGFLFIFFLPASYAFISITDDPWGSLNPLTLFKFATKLGIDYFAIWLVLGVAYLAASQALGQYRNPSFLYTLLSVFSLLLCAQHMGATIIANHLNLGIDNPEDIKQEVEENKQKRSFETAVFHFIEARKFDAAADYIEEEIKRNELITDNYVQDYLHRDKHFQVAIRHADNYLKRLADNGQLLKAWNLLLFNLSESDKYYLDDIKLLKRFVDSAMGPEQYKASICLLNRLATASETSEKIRQILKTKAMEIATIKLRNEEFATYSLLK